MCFVIFQRCKLSFLVIIKSKQLSFSRLIHFSSYEAAEILRVLFEKKHEDFECNRFITNLDEDYPF